MIWSTTLGSMVVTMVPLQGMICTKWFCSSRCSTLRMGCARCRTACTAGSRSALRRGGSPVSRSRPPEYDRSHRYSAVLPCAPFLLCLKSAAAVYHPLYPVQRRMSMPAARKFQLLYTRQGRISAASARRCAGNGPAAKPAARCRKTARFLQTCTDCTKMKRLLWRK